MWRLMENSKQCCVFQPAFMCLHSQKLVLILFDVSSHFFFFCTKRVEKCVIRNFEFTPQSRLTPWGLVRGHPKRLNFKVLKISNAFALFKSRAIMWNKIQMKVWKMTWFLPELEPRSFKTKSQFYNFELNNPRIFAYSLWLDFLLHTFCC